ncbi:hypothetical protein Q1695_003915 [Nippostrongylus brasiliensis]|nr:hypothetical protein Q1695_003915 [Nippostrongylus brasiliensis]
MRSSLHVVVVEAAAVALSSRHCRHSLIVLINQHHFPPPPPSSWSSCRRMHSVHPRLNAHVNTAGYPTVDGRVCPEAL